MYRKAAGAVLAGGLLCGTAACTDGSGQAAGRKPARTTAQKPVEVTPAVAVKRASDKNGKLASVSYTMNGQVPGGVRVEGRAAVSFKPLAMSMKMKQRGAGNGADVEVRLVDGAMYLNGGREAAAEMDGKSWLKFDFKALGKATGGQDPLAGLGSQADRNPAEDSASLTAAKDLEKVGEETVGGVTITHYKGTVTPARMRESLRNVDAATRKRRERGLERYEQMGIKALTMDMWIDGEDRTKRFRTRAASAQGPLDLTITFLDYDKPVTVAAPPASATTDLAEMFKGMKSGRA
ncbi:DUF1396 domain-containing protein [Streptomyces sp. NPDC057445]|uniref:DUF1396 domain-containing protein n=1 Tax=Streptomyces sp. NPDC057445 TaxID=3346136 RepID=UPI0036CDC08D